MFYKIILIFVIGLLLISNVNSKGYHQKNVTRVAAPSEGGITILRGYDSKTGTLAETCLKTTNLSFEEGKGELLTSSYKFVHSAQEIIQEKEWGISAKLAYTGVVASGSVNVEANFYKRNEKNIENGAAFISFYDSAKPKFANSAKNYELNLGAKVLIEKSIRKGKHNLFNRRCGDSVIIGHVQARSFTALGFMEATSELSQEDKETKVAAAGRYMGAQFGMNVEVRGKKLSKKERKQITIDFTASGDPELPSAKNITELSTVFSAFTTLDKSQTLDYIYVYTIPYEKLVDLQNLDLGISQKRLKSINQIIDASYLIARARNQAKVQFKKEKNQGKKLKYNMSFDFLREEYKNVISILKSEKGCLKQSKRCDNLTQRFKSFPSSNNAQKINKFIERATIYGKKCYGFPVTRPNGLPMCSICNDGREPSFLNQNEGKCVYIVNKKKPRKGKRFFAKDLKKSKNFFIEAGVKVKVTIYPNYCNKPSKDCNKKAAKKLCKKLGFNQSAGFGLWKRSHNTSSTKFAYPNGKFCKASRNNFSAIKCKTFSYIDCVNKN